MCVGYLKPRDHVTAAKDLAVSFFSSVGKRSDLMYDLFKGLLQSGNATVFPQPLTGLSGRSAAGWALPVLVFTKTLSMPIQNLRTCELGLKTPLALVQTHTFAFEQ